jgi:hypothetical protein
MSRGKPWTEEDTATLERMAGRVPDAEIGRMTGHEAITIRKRRSDLGLSAYRPRTRRQWLMNAAAGLDFQISDCPI